MIPAMSSLKLFGTRTVKMECWFCQQVNILDASSSEAGRTGKGKAKEPMFPLEGTRNNFRCQFCGNRNLRDRVSGHCHDAFYCSSSSTTPCQDGNLCSSLPEMYNPAFNPPSWVDGT